MKCLYDDDWYTLDQIILCYRKGELRCSGRVSSSCSTSGIRGVNLVTKPGDKSSMRKGPGSAYDKWNISVVIFETNTP
jgi:hypothetical protein